VHKTLQKEPLQDPRKKKGSAGNVLGLLVSMTKWFCLPVGVLLFQLKGGNKTVSLEIPPETLENTSC